LVLGLGSVLAGFGSGLAFFAGLEGGGVGVVFGVFVFGVFLGGFFFRGFVFLVYGFAGFLADLRTKESVSEV
jgi:hypothetical protein